jgi:hypothetical protein
VVHFEVGVPDAAALQAFYAKAFDWSVDADNPMNYGLVENNDEGIGDVAENDAGVIFYIQVADINAALETVKAGGGKTVEERTEIPGMVIMAKFADPAGNVIGLVEEGNDG